MSLPCQAIWKTIVSSLKVVSSPKSLSLSSVCHETSIFKKRHVIGDYVLFITLDHQPISVGMLFVFKCEKNLPDQIHVTLHRLSLTIYYAIFDWRSHSVSYTH